MSPTGVVAACCIALAFGEVRASTIFGSGVGPNNLDACLAAFVDARHKVAGSAPAGVPADRSLVDWILTSGARSIQKSDRSWSCTLAVQQGLAPDSARDVFAMSFFAPVFESVSQLEACASSMQHGFTLAQGGYGMDAKRFIGFDSNRVSTHFTTCLCEHRRPRCAANVRYEYAPPGTVPTVWDVQAQFPVAGLSAIREIKQAAAPFLLGRLKEQAERAKRLFGGKPTYVEPDNVDIPMDNTKGLGANNPVFCEHDERGRPKGCMVTRSVRLTYFP